MTAVIQTLVYPTRGRRKSWAAPLLYLVARRRNDLARQLVSAQIASTRGSGLPSSHAVIVSTTSA